MGATVFGGARTAGRGALAAVAAAGAAFLLVGVSAAAPGDLDPSFGDGGIVTTAFGQGDDVAEALVLQADGKLVAAGWCRCEENAVTTFALARYHPDGSLDTSFGGDGKVTTSVGPNGASARAVVVQPDGKLVAAGNTGTGSEEDFALARYNPDGSLDTSFGGDGTVTTSIGYFDYARALVVQEDGKLVAAGATAPSSARNERFALVRYNPDGSLDASFGVGGIVTTGLGRGTKGAHALALQDDGKLVAAGSSGGAPRRFALVRYNADGSLDASFGNGGIVLTRHGRKGAEAHALVVQGDGKLVAGGSGRTSTWSFALARYNPDGSLDASFGGGDGKVRTTIGLGSLAFALALQQDGRLVAAGDAGQGGPYPDFALARYNADGSLDTSFGGHGTVITPISDSYDRAESVVVQPDGKPVAAGWAYVPAHASFDFALARYSG